MLSKFGRYHHACNVVFLWCCSDPHLLIYNNNVKILIFTARYQANIMFVDEWVGQILNALSTTGDIDRTFIIWTADHGDGQEDHYHYRKGFPYELSAHIPLLLVWPFDTAYLPTSLRGGRVSDSGSSSGGGPVVPRGTVMDDVVTELRDVFPTFLDAINATAMVPAGHPIDGASLLCLLRDPR